MWCWRGCLERGADLHMAQLMTLPLTVSCFSKIQVGFTFLVPADPGSPGQRAVKRLCVCGVVSDHIKKGLLLSLSEKKLKLVNIWQSYKQERDCIVHFLRLLAVCWPGARTHTHTHIYIYIRQNNNLSCRSDRARRHVSDLLKFCIT